MPHNVTRTVYNNKTVSRYNIPYTHIYITIQTHYLYIHYYFLLRLSVLFYLDCAIYICTEKNKKIFQIKKKKPLQSVSNLWNNLAMEHPIYCKICSYPPEYCEFSGKLKRCKEWLANEHQDLYTKLYGNGDDVDELAGKLNESSIGADREGKLEKDLLKLQRKEENKEQRELAKKLSSKVIIKREARTKRKSIVVVQGLEVFEIDMKKLAKTFASKFATGCSVSKNVEKKEEVVIQGDVMEEVESYIHQLLTEKGLKDVKVETVDAAKKKKKPTTPTTN